MEPAIGLREKPIDTIVFTNATIHVSPTNTIVNGSLVIKDGKIIDVGQNIKRYKRSRTIDCTDKHIYPGFIDMMIPVDVDSSLFNIPTKHWNKRVHAQYRPVISKGKNTSLHSLGFLYGLLTPNSGIFRGYGNLVSLTDYPEKLTSDVFETQHLAMEHGGWDDDDYPNSLLGSIALIRQTFYDSQWYKDAWSIFNKHPNLNIIPDIDDALSSISEEIANNTPFVFHIKQEKQIERVANITKEFSLNPWMIGTGYEYRNINLFNTFKPFIILPLDLPGKPNVSTKASELNVDLRELKHWDQAPYNPIVMINNGIEFSITSHLLSKNDFKNNLNKVIEFGLESKDALAALTTIPAKRLQVDHIIGTLDKGKVGNLFISDRDYFDVNSNIISVWVNGLEHEIAPQSDIDVRGYWVLDGGFDTLKISGKNSNSIKAKMVSDTTIINLEGFEYSYPSIHFYYSDVNNSIQRFSGNIFEGKIYGENTDVSGISYKKIYSLSDKYQKKNEFENEVNVSEQLDVFYPEGAYGFLKIPMQQKGTVLIQNATVWTSSRKGILNDCDVLIKDGIFSKISKDIRPPKNAILINGRGKHITAGIIDCHSHTALSAVNEGSQAITSEVRIKDVINPYDIAIYRELAGGLTTANLLHGSANPIGGQNAVIKLKWGNSASAMIFPDAKEGIKFALGENVKQSNWGDDYTDRYPQTRMGVDQIMRDAFNTALDYEVSLKNYNKGNKKKTIPIRRDLELEALLEIINGDRLIHCHSYRQDEILNLIRIAEDFGFTIGTFQHVLEGYKVAEAMKQHGAGASTFSDWWAYKFEVYDAIPYNGDIMHKVGVNVSFNSDSNELARRMNLEAAKAMRYGDLSESEAIKLVTINPAQQLHIDDRVGSIEVGKDADFVIWNGNPLSAYTICEQTWIEGIQYFDLDTDLKYRKRDADLRSKLINKALKSSDAIDKNSGKNKYHPKFKSHSCGLELEDERVD